MTQDCGLAHCWSFFGPHRDSGTQGASGVAQRGSGRSLMGQGNRILVSGQWQRMHVVATAQPTAPTMHQKQECSAVGGDTAAGTCKGGFCPPGSATHTQRRRRWAWAAWAGSGQRRATRGRRPADQAAAATRPALRTSGGVNVEGRQQAAMVPILGPILIRIAAAPSRRIYILGRNIRP